MRRIAAFRQIALVTWTFGAVAAGLALGMCWTIGSTVAAAQSPADREKLAKEVSAVPVSLAQGLVASRSEGRPISAKFELEDGKLQLSVYTDKDGRFSEVIVDHKSGKVAKAEAITDGDDISHAKAQSEAMAKAKRSLDAAASVAMKQNKDYRVVSVMPALKGGHPVAEVTLVKGKDWKTVSEKLD
jgi:uncharacterized membrane protein YkoI